MTEMDDGSIEVPVVHDLMVRMRFAKRNVLWLRGTKRVRVELQWPGTPLPLPFSLSIRFHMI